MSTADPAVQELAQAVASLAVIVEEMLEAIWLWQSLDANRIGRMRVLAHVSRGVAETLGGLKRKG